MTLDDLKREYRNGNDFYIKTGLSHVNWHNWLRMGHIPIVSQMKIEHITKGALKADLEHVPRDDNDR